VKIAMFYHSLLSDWNHGNAHFLRGVVWELVQRNHEVFVFEPEDSWSLANLLRRHGSAPLLEFQRAYPGLQSHRYRLSELDLDEVLDNADLVLVHEWNDPELVRRIGAHRQCAGRYTLLFHDTHHRSVTAAAVLACYDLSGYDGVLAYGKAIATVYLERQWSRAVWTWHEAADTRVFRPLPDVQKELDLVWIGNWGDDERREELTEFLLRPVQSLKLKAAVYGVRYPERALKELRAAGIEYRGWLANFRAPEIFARARATVHIPRRPYAAALPGIPTIRPFEALACGIPLICAPWQDSENLFTSGEDFLCANDGAEMTERLETLISRPERAQALAQRGRQTILQRHTCGHRVDELLAIQGEVTPPDGHSTIGRAGAVRPKSTI
jgi:spore maturation protein CgeB